ncbi:hypothetical protein HED60_12315 [Planctomycetales bacterium ZRK34]|nr:hypothetical protein HED60_12315 [Planctomycetales bacterium ZRK34]
MGEMLRANPAQVRPTTRTQLRGWLRWTLGIEVPGTAVCNGHGTPLDYLEHVFFERPGDAVVWANRGGGKTFYGAVATLLDLLFKPGVRVCILGGSMEQSQRMFEHLKWMLDRPWARPLIDGKLTERGVRLINGSRVTLAAQSQTSVRGHRVQKLRCDEVELFDPEVWAAAQFVTRSAVCGGQVVRGSVEALSTMHRPFGLMHELIEGAGGADPDDSPGSSSGLDGGGWKVFGWCALDVMRRCEVERVCERCGLWEACGGRAKTTRGFVAVSDVLDQQRRSGREQFASEMLCRRPSRSDAVFAEFDPAVHVRAVEADEALTWVGGMDFGLRDPLVMLWAQLRPMADGHVCVEVIDEYVQTETIVDRHLEAIGRRPWPRPRWLGVDPAGNQRESQTGRSTIDLLKAAGYTVRSRCSTIAEGLTLLRRRIAPAAADVQLVIHPRCGRLIESMASYHFDPQRPRDHTPVKDGHDHAVDALRYMVMNMPGGAGAVKVRCY